MKKKVIIQIISILAVLSIGGLSAILIINNLLPTKFQVGIIGTLLLILILGVFLSTRKSKASQVIGIVLKILLIILTSISSYYLYTTISSIDNISTSNKPSEIKNELSVVKLKSTDLKEIVAERKLELDITESEDKQRVQELLEELKKVTDENFTEKNVNSYISAADNLVLEKSDLMVLNEAFRPMINEHILEFDDITEVVTSKTFSELANTKTKDEVGSTFNVYVSGIDTFGPIQTVSRSDVNLILSVNQETRKILITTIPRDTYLPIAEGGNDQMDKLTHAGVYGVQSSIKTLENFLDIDIDYYVKVNFNTLIDIVNLLDGIDVENPQEFTTNGLNFPKGKIHLDGKKALVFSRERYTLQDGDRDRGRNQERVLKAMIEKGTRPENLLKANGVLNILEKGAETNLSKAQMIEMVNREFDSSTRYKIDTQDLKGTGKIGLPSYAMPGFELYMMVPDETSLSEVKEMIKENQKVN
ncbi:LCP family protein [Lagierella sp.]|uniref:LCP family protein n=1 Tax=Lagierella sp. TaxID=2849657 RepID=UPI002603031F|nr:LCP family protein [Lagierella sp.]